MATVDQALDVVMQLDAEQRELLIGVLRRRQIEERREEIAAHAQEAIGAFHAGELRTESIETLLERLHTSLTEQTAE